MGSRRRRARPRALGVIAADADDLKLRHLAVIFILSKFLLPGADAIDVRDIQIPGRKGRTEMAFERGFIGEVLLLRCGIRIITGLAAAARFAIARTDKLTVAAITQPCAFAIIPDIT